MGTASPIRHLLGHLRLRLHCRFYETDDFDDTARTLFILHWLISVKLRIAFGRRPALRRRYADKISPPLFLRDIHFAAIISSLFLIIQRGRH